MDFEGIDIGSWNEGPEGFETWIQAHEKDFHSTESYQYLTSFGPANGTKIVAILNEQAALHAFSKIDQFRQQPQEIIYNFFQDRYSADTF